MEAAKAAIKNFTSHGGHHDTTVHEHVNPAVEQERLHRKEIEETTTVVDKEVHQDQYHTSVLPVKDREVLPEQHSHNLVGAESREYRHGDHEGIKARLEQEAAEFKNTRTTGETIKERNVAPTVGGEHVHHHIHETVQPIIQKDTIQPVIVHTTVPVHETHHNAPKHHGASALPAMTMEEFKTRGGSLEGCEDKVDRYEGIIPAEEAVKNTSHGFHHHGHGGAGGNAAREVEGTRGTGITGNETRYENDGLNSGTTGTTGSTGIGGTHHGHGGVGGNVAREVEGTRGTGITGNETRYENDGLNSGATGGLDGSRYNNNAEAANIGSGTTTTKKPSLLDKLNPKVDSNGDGKAGFMK